MNGDLIRVEHVSLDYKGLERRALDDVSLAVAAGATLGIVGESGSGKSSLARCMLGLESYSGKIMLDGEDIQTRITRDRKSFARSVQMVFQDPLNSLNPRMTIGAILTEVLTVHGLSVGEAANRDAVNILKQVGLGDDVMERYPHEMSGGQRQRAGIARALLVKPALIIADEPVSALDVSVQAQIIELLTRLVRETGVALILIAHDLAVVRYVCERIAVMKAGKICEQGAADKIIDAPDHPYTRLLLDAVPDIDTLLESGAAR